MNLSGLTSFTGGGALDAGSGASNGDNMFANEFNYRTGGQVATQANNNIVALAVVAVAFVYLMGRK